MGRPLHRLRGPELGLEWQEPAVLAAGSDARTS